MIFLDTSVLIEAAAVVPESPVSAPMRWLIACGERIEVPSVVLYEFLRGPRRTQELAFQESLFPQARAVPFGSAEAAQSARLYRAVPRARGREVDLAIAGTAISRGALLWTLNPRDFADVPGIRLWSFTADPLLN